MSTAARLASRLSARLGLRPKKAKQETIRLPGLARPATVAWDEAYVPHLEAESRRDLMLLQGFVTARERAFQMDFLRRAVSGRLAEILGRRPMAWRDLTIHLKHRTIPEGDLLLRSFGLRRAAEASVDAASDQTQELLHAYAQGVNLAFEAIDDSLPVEFRLLRYRPEPWGPADSVSVLKGMAFELSMAWRTILLLDAISFRLRDDPEKMKLLFPYWPGHAVPPAAWNGLREHSADELDLEESYRAFTAMGGAHVGSNAWAVSGARTQSGQPILCGDPHLMMTAPSPHFIVHLRSPDLNVVGSSVPGLPGVIMGHNERIAWSMTASVAQDADIFVEELDRESRRYKVGDRWEPLEIIGETIHVKGEKTPEYHEVHRTRHGPLIHEVTYPLSDEVHRYGHAIRWIGHDASTDIDGVLELNSAGNWLEFRQALRKMTAPSLNFVYADVDGHIGWQLAGAFPVRKDGSDGLRPADGASGASDWERYLDLDELPHLYDPPGGVIVSANTKPVDDNYPWPLGHNWEPYFRYQRIEQLLTEGVAGRKLSVHDMARVQTDQRSTWAERVMEDLFRPVLETTRFESPKVETARKTLLAWRFDSKRDSAGAAIFYFAYDQLIRRLIEEQLGEDLTHAYFEMLNLSVMPFENMIQSGDSALLSGQDRAARVCRALEDATSLLVDRFGQSEPWAWGRVHTLWHRHRMHEIKALRPLLSVGPFDVGGDGMCVNNGHYSHAQPFEMIIGPGLRHIEDLSDWGNSLFITNHGNSGDVRSAHYRDYAAMWAAGEYHRLRFDAGGDELGAAEIFEP